MIQNRAALHIMNGQPKYLWFLIMSYAMIISISNWYDSRLISLFNLTISPGTLSFPLSFLVSDIITEVYGYKNARKAIWAALFFNSAFLIFGEIITKLPSPSFAIENNEAFDKLLHINFWIICGSFTSYLVSEPINSYFIAKLKVICNGKYIGLRFISSTIIATLIDSIIFISIAFHNLINRTNLLKMILTVWLIKCIIEIIGLPISIRLANWLKGNEKLDIYDVKTNFNPFSLNTNYDSNNNRYYKN